MQRTTYTHAQDTGRVLLHVYLKVLVKLFCYGFARNMPIDKPGPTLENQAYFIIFINNISFFNLVAIELNSCQFFTDQYHAVSATCMTQRFNRATCTHKMAMQRLKVDLVASNVYRVYVYIHVFCAK